MSQNTAAPQGSGINVRELAGDARSLSLEDFEETHGSSFLLATASLQEPQGPASTVVELGDVEAPSECTGVLAILAYPVRRTGRSVGHLITLGRTPNNDVVIRDRSVSRFHAFLKQPDEDRFQILDAGSSNGTVVNGSSVPLQGHGEPVDLKSGDNLRLGQVELTFVSAAGLQSYVREMQI